MDAERRKLRPGSGGEKPPEEPPFTYQLKAVPLKFVTEIKDIVLTEAESIGSSAIFECLISPSTAATSWMKDGFNIRESPKHRFLSDGKDRKLHIIDVQLSDAGEYTCVLKLGNKEKTSTAKLVVEGSSWCHLIYTTFSFVEYTGQLTISNKVQKWKLTYNEN